MRRQKTWRILCVIALVAIIGVAGLRAISASNSKKSVVETRRLLGTFVTLTVYAPTQAEAREHIEAGFGRIAELEKILSAKNPDAELAKLNKSAGAALTQAHEELFNAIQAGVEWHERSNGAFDISIMPLLSLWQKAAKEKRLPTQEQIADAKARMGVSRIRLDADSHSVALQEGMELDLGGLGKGFTADAVAALLRERGVKNALVANSGDICAMGTNPDGGPWRIGVQDPRRPDDPQALLTVLNLKDISVSTSGNYQRFVEIDGKRYSHIVDPRTGLTADEVPGVTVIGPDTLTTDIMGTALSVLGVKDGLALVENMPGVEALFITFDEENKPHLTRSSGFAKYEAPGKAIDYRK